MMSIDNPPAGGGVALETALKILQGLPVAHDNFIDTTITVTKGDERLQSRPTCRLKITPRWTLPAI